LVENPVLGFPPSLDLPRSVEPSLCPVDRAQLDPGQPGQPLDLQEVTAKPGVDQPVEDLIFGLPGG
jgi:hypothetical protein